MPALILAGSPLGRCRRELQGDPKNSQVVEVIRVAGNPRLLEPDHVLARSEEPGRDRQPDPLGASFLVLI